MGTATGHPLESIVDGFPSTTQVLGIDIDTNYIPACAKLFAGRPNVQIREMNFYDLPQEVPNHKFDVIIFGSSFMLMPNQEKALEIAKSSI